MAKGVILALIAGVVGAAVWAGIAYGTGFEIGWIAWGIGALVGFAMGMGVGTSGNAATGVAAAVIALVAIAGGKFLAVELMIASELDEAALVDEVDREFDNDEYVISYMADAEVQRRLDAGDELTWPETADLENPAVQDDYPADVWAVAQAQWDGMSPEDRETYRQEQRAIARQNAELFYAQLHSDISRDGFIASFGLFDVIFFGLGAFTAYRLGAGGMGGDEAGDAPTDTAQA